MKRKMTRHFSAVLTAALVASSVVGAPSVPVYADEISTTARIELTDEEVAKLTGEVSYDRTSVHDPSVIADGEGNYYIFGSHMGVSKTSDLQNWTSVTGESLTSTLFGNAEGEIVSYAEAFTKNAYTGTVTVLDEAGNEIQVDFGTYDAANWISDNTVAGNMWAPDVIYNEAMDKWCMYMSLNGATWNSSIVLMTSDNIEGPYVYQGPVVFSGFSTTDSSKSFKNTDLELVIGEQDELPEKYQKIADSSWGTYWPHAIDPAVFYDEAGNLWLVYGSWSGGIYVLELDENTGLRDYTVSYEDTFDALGASVTSDPYFGTKIAGGYYVSGEGAYVEHIGNYYYLFVSYGFYSPEGGYNMRVFRSETPDGPYVDASGNSAIFNKYIMNYSSTNAKNNIGMKLMGNYKWDTMDKAEVAQGHNSAFVDEDGKAYVVYHTKFADGTVAHEVRVHQLFMSQDGWLVAAPYEYSGETLSETGYSLDAVVGQYGIIIHDYQVDYADLEYFTPEYINLNADGTITGAYEGTWSMVDGTPYANIVIGGAEYQGVFTEQVIDGSNITTMCFTVVSDAGLSIWGSGEPTDDAVVAQNAANPVVKIPANTYTDLSLTTEGLNGATITWTSSMSEVLSAEGVVTKPAEDTVVTLTETISKGDYFYQREHLVTVKADSQNSTDSLVAGSYFEEAVDLSQHLAGSLSVPNPFYCGTNNGLDLSGGVTIEFDAVATGDVHVLGTIFSFLANGGNNGRLYFTPGSYLGYNADGGYFDANLLNYGLVTDYIGESAHVAINITKTGFTVTVNDEVAYTEEILTTENGSGSVTDYSKVLDWLYNTADTLYFGHGSWWNAAGYDEANVLLSNVVCSVGPVAEKEVIVTDTVEYTKDSVVLSTNADITIEENPFYGKNIDNFYAEFKLNMTEGAAQNGWDGIFSFYNSTTTGRMSVQTAPYVCFNDWLGNWIDINQPGADGATDMAPSMVPGTEYLVTISITKDDIIMTVDGVELAISEVGSGADCEDILAFIPTADQLSWGVGLAQTSFWNTELCTLTDIKLSSVGGTTEGGDTEEDVVVNTNPQIIADEVVLAANADITYIDNPFENAAFDAVAISYTANFSEEAIKTGWDGLFAFYNSTNGGRVSIQSAPYICYNDMSGKWMDINQPGETSTLLSYGLVAGVDYDFDIVITEEAVKMYINGVQVAITENGSGASYADLIDFIGTCDQFTWGVGQATTAFWWTELCTLKNVEITSHVPATAVYENAGYTIDAANYLEVTENPYYGQDLERLYLEYTINFADTAAKNGWDGIMSFYNSTTGGRVSIQSAPYICYNDMVGNWMDINQPGAGGDNAAALAATGEDVVVTIDITETGIAMTVNGTPIAIAENGSGATYADLLAFISECDQLTLGVGEAVTAFWWSEICTVSNVKMTPVFAAAVSNDETMGTVNSSVNGADATFTAIPADFCEFIGWYAGDVLISTEASIDVSVCKNTLLTAQFSKLPYQVTYNTTASYGTYLLGTVTVKNVSGETLKNWSVSFDYAGTITSLWGAMLESQTDGVVVVEAPSWDKELADGEELTFSFTAVIDNAEEIPVPQNIVVTGKEAVVADSSVYTVEVVKNSEWPKGYIATISITNNGTETLESWTIECDFADTIVTSWNCLNTSPENGHYVITNAGYNADIAPGQTITLGFIAKPADGALTSTAEFENVVLTSLK